MTSAPRRGRRPASEDTRGRIVAAARESFSRNGYAATTLRGVARAAGVDPALVHHYFDGKQALFVEVVQVPVRPSQLVPRLVEGGLDGAGERIARTFLGVWDAPEARDRLLALLVSATGDEAAARMLREFVVEELLARVLEGLGVDDVPRRAALVASQVVGLALVRFVLRLEPVASMPGDELARLLGPALQHHLEG